jgi:perosamine synthetase
MENKPKQFQIKNDLPLMSETEGTVLFYPHVGKNAKKYVNEVLDSRWIGQGPKVELFEEAFAQRFRVTGNCISTGSGTDALHLGYILAGIKAGDEVLAPLFTCTATNIPLLYLGAKIKFVDVNPRTLNICTKDLRNKISERTRLIVLVHYGGLPCDMQEIKEIAAEYGVPVLEDAAHALGAEYDGMPVGSISEFTMFSFQAIKQLTTADGGMLVTREPDPDVRKKAKRIRWFGIDREDKQKGVWENDIWEVGYKYQMNDVAAAIGLAGLEEWEFISNHRKTLYDRYVKELHNFNDAVIVDDFDKRKKHGCWLFTVLVENRQSLQKKLRDHKIESGQTHYRNDRYSVFNCEDSFPSMDSVDNTYLIMPLHTKMTEEDVKTICEVIKNGW